MKRERVGGRELLRVVTPPFRLVPPRLENRALVPPQLCALMEQAWLQRDFAGRDIVFSEVENAIVAEQGLVFTDTLAAVRASVTNHAQDEFDRSRAAIAGALAAGGLPARDGTYVLCKKNGSSNYGHWLMEMFPKAVLALRHLPDSGALRFVVPATGTSLDDVIAASMAKLGIGPDRLLAVTNEPVRVARLILVEGLTAHGSYMSPLAVEAVRGLVYGVQPGPYRQLFVQRSHAAGRGFTDPDAVAARAMAHGHVPIEPGTADLDTQIALFSGARRIVGIMGAAMTSIVFAPPDAEIVMLAPCTMPDTFFWFIAALRGLRYTEIRCDIEGEGASAFGWRKPMTFPEAHGEAIFPSACRLGVAQGLPPSVSAPPLETRTYRRVTLAELAADPSALVDGRPAVERVATLPPYTLDVPAIAFGDTDLAASGIVTEPAGDAGAMRLRRGGAPVFRLRHATVHGQLGVVTIGDRVVAETLAHFPIHLVAGARWERADLLRLPELPRSGEVHSAYHLLNCNLDNYYHWLIEVVARFRPADYAAFARDPDTLNPPNVLVPTQDVAWKWESLAAVLPAAVPRLVLGAQGRVFAQRLLYVQDASGGGMAPHELLLDTYDAMRAAVLGAGTVRPWRRIYVSRADSQQRVLANEAAVMARAERAGFTSVVLSKLSVAEQIRLFAEASHIIAPHGAGLVNIGFCQPGTALLELQMDRYLHSVFRRIAAMRGLRYGWLIGAATGPRRDWVHQNVWTLDLARLDAVLTDARFIGPAARSAPPPLPPVPAPAEPLPVRARPDGAATVEERLAYAQALLRMSLVDDAD